MANPVPRVRHPDWLHKKILEKNDTYKQRLISDMFSVRAKSSTENSEKTNDIEDIGTIKSPTNKKPIANVNKRKRSDDEFTEEELNKSWREILGNPPAYGTTKV